jgi:hypothetical protein
MALITYHQTLITFVLFFSVINQTHPLIRIINYLFIAP